jgi:phosphoglucosamine mutase
VISASHNPFQDNGIKIFGRDGFKLADDIEARVEGIVRGRSSLPPRKTGPGIGQATKVEDARGRYVAFAKNTFPRNISLEGLRLVVDAAHGAAYRVAPAVFTELGATVVSIGVHPDGKNINEGRRPSPRPRSGRGGEASAQIGIALDGDADRVILIDEKGRSSTATPSWRMCALELAETRSSSRTRSWRR